MVPGLVGVAIALIIGMMAGSAGTRAKRARLDYRRTKSLIGTARKLAWAETVRGLKVVAVALMVMVALAVVLNTLGQR